MDVDFAILEKFKKIQTMEPTTVVRNQCVGLLSETSKVITSSDVQITI